MSQERDGITRGVRRVEGTSTWEPIPPQTALERAAFLLRSMKAHGKKHPSAENEIAGLISDGQLSPDDLDEMRTQINEAPRF